MRFLFSLFGCSTPFVLFVLFCWVYIKLPSWSGPSVDDIINKAKKFLKKRPGTRLEEIREALIDHYAKPPQDRDALGSGWVLGVRIGKWLLNQRYEHTKRAVARNVDIAFARMNKNKRRERERDSDF